MTHTHAHTHTHIHTHTHTHTHTHSHTLTHTHTHTHTHTQRKFPSTTIGAMLHNAWKSELENKSDPDDATGVCAYK